MDTTPLIEVMPVLLVTLVTSLSFITHAASRHAATQHDQHPTRDHRSQDRFRRHSGMDRYDSDQLSYFCKLFLRIVKCIYVSHALVAAQRNRMLRIVFVNTLEVAN
jgi:hypothetical protein